MYPISCAHHDAGLVARAINAGGFLAIGQYTSHMTGVVSAIADGLVLGLSNIRGLGLLSIVSFIVGAGWGRRNVRRMQYVFSVPVAAVLMSLSTPLMVTRRLKLPERSSDPASPDGITEADVSRFTLSQPRPTGAIR